MKKQHRILILAVIAGMVLALGVRLWANGEALSIAGPTSLRQGDDGRIYAMTDRQLLVLTDTGELVKRIPLSRFGLNEFVGDFWVNDQQEILLRAARPEGGLTRWLRVLLRIGGDGEDQTPVGVAALQWCPLAGGACRPFGPDFRSTRTFRLAKDKAAGAVLIADTAQHRLLRLDAKGVLEATSAPHFRFPNGMVVGADGLLYITDTNHHRIVAVQLGAKGFGEPHREFNVEAAISSHDRKWPMGIAQTPDGAFWTINAAENMAFGDILVYENDSRIRQKLTLPLYGDPMSLLLVKDRMLVADPRSFQIMTFDLQGNPRRTFGDSSFTDEMDKLKRQRDHYRTISTSALIALVALVLAAFGIQRWQQGRP